MGNLFLEHLENTDKNISYTENGALSYKSIGSALMDQFSRSGSASGRDIERVWDEQEKLWSEDPEMALRFPFYLRMISRETRIGSDIMRQNGCGMRDEAFKRLLWIESRHPDEFYRNLWLLPYVGSWKDLVTLYTYCRDIDFDKVYSIIASGLEKKDEANLIWKYMPRIVSGGKLKTDEQRFKTEFAKRFCAKAGISHKVYRQLKSNGSAHKFQQVICSGRYENIDWGSIPGIALSKLVSGKFLENHSLADSYIGWLSKQDAVKFNGFPVDLAVSYYHNNAVSNKYTIDLQFNTLIKEAKDSGNMPEGNILCALDTSGSMTWTNVDGKNTTPYHIAVSLGIYFSELMENEFHNRVVMFDDVSKFKTLEGTFTEKLESLYGTNAMGGTNFQSVIDLICRERREHPEIPLEHFPTTLLVVSDMQFNPAGYSGNDTNIEFSRAKMKYYFPEEWVDNFRFIWWNCAERGQKDVPATEEDPNSLFLSGFDGSILTMLTGIEEKKKKSGSKEKVSMEDLIYTALHQDILNLVS